MAIINAYYAFDLRNWDLGLLFDNFYSETFQDNVNYTSGGTTYEDLYEVMMLDDYFESIIFAGTDFEIDSGLYDGTVTAMLSGVYSGEDWYVAVGVTDISTSMYEIEEAALTYSTADDLALFNAELTGADVFYLSDYADYADGRAGDDMIYGYDGADTLLGDAGADTLVGDAGKDRLSGGAGSDSFIFELVSDSSKSATTADLITDFAKGRDKISLSTIDAFSTSSANDKFIWKGTSAFSSKTQGEVRYEKFDNKGSSNDYTMVWIDTDADKDVEMAIRLTGLYSLSSSDFIL